MQSKHAARCRYDAAIGSTRGGRAGRWLVFVLIWLAGIFPARSACTTCTDFRPGIVWGFTSISALTEASGIASSGRNPGVLWTHNDGARQRVYAIATNGATLGTFSFALEFDDVEDMAVGPGPTAGISYLYFGDIGGNAHPDDIRDEVRIIRVPEPLVDLAWASSPRAINFTGVQAFNLRYPDGSYDAETLLVDPVNADLFIVTKQDNSARLYRANLNSAANGSTLDLTFVRTVAFAKAAGGDISADGTQIALRREDAATLWARCNNEPIGTALGRTGASIPVIGPPEEDNGEAIAFLRDGSGYVTISEGDDQPVHYFRSSCLKPLVVRISSLATKVRIEFDAVAGRRYSLEARKGFAGGTWTPTGHTMQPTSDGVRFFEVERSIDNTFYRVAVQ